MKTDKKPRKAAQQQDKYLVRFLIDGTRDKLKQEGAAKGVSLNAEINARLIASFNQHALADYPVEDLVAEILRRYKPDEIFIRIGTLDGGGDR